MERPVVSVITPVRNGRAYLADCIESVLSQSYPNIEHVIVDAQSDDGTLEIILEYHKKYPDRIRFISEPDNGPGDGWNKGLKMAKGDIFGCLGYDDLYLPDSIATVVRFFADNPKAQFIHGDCDFINATGETIGRHKTEEFDYRHFVNTARHISTPSAFYKREVIEKIGWLDASGDDFDVMLRIARDYDIHRIGQTLSKLRLHSSAFRPSNFSKRKDLQRDTFKVSRKYGGHIFSRIAVVYYYYVVFDLLHIDFLHKYIKRFFIKTNYP